MVVLGIQQHALVAAGIVDDARAELGAVLAADDEGANRVGAVINADGKHGGEEDLTGVKNFNLGKSPKG